MQYVAIIAFDQRGEGQKRRLNLMTHLWSCSDLGHQKFISQAASTDNDNVGGLNTQKTPHLHPEWTMVPIICTNFEFDFCFVGDLLLIIATYYK